MDEQSDAGAPVWRNRIVSYGERPAREFTAHELNARRHPDEQRTALRGSLGVVGWVAPVVVSQRSGKILDGHARVEEAIAAGDDTPVPYVFVDVDEREETLILATLDPITGMATYDREVLTALLDRTETSDTALMSLMADLAEREKIIPATDDARQAETGQVGDLEYRVVVDATSEQHQAELLARFEAEGLKCRLLIS